MNKFFAKKTPCANGHTHSSAKEAKRCGELHLLLRSGAIDGLVVEPTFILTSQGEPIKMGNGQAAKYRPDFTYLEKGRVVAEDVKPSNGWQSRDVPLRFALFRACYPEIELRIVK